MMRNVVNNYIEKFRHKKRARRRFASIAAVLAMIVSCGVFWQLRAEGAEMANETFCGFEEHQHSEECYEPVLTCGSEEGGDRAGHTHDESCYEAGVTLVCGLEESEEHMHTDECFETTQTLICGQEESEASEGHTHTDECYEEQLICDIPEHTHTIACMSDDSGLITAEAEPAGTFEDIEDVEEMDGYIELLADVAAIDDEDDNDDVEYVYPVDIFKFTGDWDTGDVTALSGAEFVLSKVMTEADEVTGVETEVTYYGVFDKTEENVGEPGTIYYFTLIDWTADISGATALVSGDDGFIHMADLPAETTYHMAEIKAPDGYILSDKVIQFYVWADEETEIGYVTDETVINAGIYKYYDLDDQIITLYIGNEADAEFPDTGGAELPNTGGAGTWIFTLFGLLIMGGAAGLLYRSGKRGVTGS